MRLVEVNRIWDRGPHNAFTDLVRFQGRWFCVFREGQGHVSPDGALRVIVSDDGLAWESAALVTSQTADLRDAKISVTPSGKLMLAGAGALHDRSRCKHQSLVWFSKDGVAWDGPHEVAEPDFWLWRVTWHRDTAYGFGYGTAPDNQVLRLYSSPNGRDFGVLVENAFDVGYPNETSMAFLQDDTCYCLLRRDGEPNTAQLGTALPPYTDWQWCDLGVRAGGPHMLQLPDGRFVATVRRYDGGARTTVDWLDVKAGTLTEALRLPSGGDTSYAGQVWHDGLLWVSYYSSHEEKTAIYLARVEV